MCAGFYETLAPTGTLYTKVSWLMGGFFSLFSVSLPSGALLAAASDPKYLMAFLNAWRRFLQTDFSQLQLRDSGGFRLTT